MRHGKLSREGLTQVMKAWNHVHSLGLGGFLCGGLLGLLSLIYPSMFPPHTTTHDILLVGGFLGAGFQKLLARLFGPVHFYLRLLQLILLRPVIGERMQGEITRVLTLRHFLGEQRANVETEQTLTRP
jgi:hypothetical protein